MPVSIQPIVEAEYPEGQPWGPLPPGVAGHSLTMIKRLRALDVEILGVLKAGSIEGGVAYGNVIPETDLTNTLGTADLSFLGLYVQSIYDEGGTLAFDTSTGKGVNAALAGTYTTFTPTLQAVTADPTLGTGSTALGRYKIVDGIAHVWIYWKFGSSGTAAGSGTYYWHPGDDGAPTMSDTAFEEEQTIGSGYLYGDATTDRDAVIPVWGTDDRVYFYTHAGGNTFVDDNSPFAWNQNDVFSIYLAYPTDD